MRVKKLSLHSWPVVKTLTTEVAELIRPTDERTRLMVLIAQTEATDELNFNTFLLSVLFHETDDFELCHSTFSSIS